MAVCPTRDEFIRLAENYNIIPVRAGLDTDLETPLTLYNKLIGDELGFMLESAETGKNFGRYSFIGAKPFAVFTAKGKGSEITIDGKTEIVPGKPLQALRKIMGEFKAMPLENLPLMPGGAVGYFAYDIIGTFERVRGHVIPDDLLLCQLLFCQVLVVMDHLTHSSQLVVLARIQPGVEPGKAYDDAVALLQETEAKLREPVVAMPDGSGQTDNNTFTSNVTKERFKELVEISKEHIRAGDIFQVVVSQRLTAPLTIHPFALYRRLRRLNPSPYMFYINFGPRTLVGASPEMLVKNVGGRVNTRPIAGTRPRGKDAAEDASLAADLLDDIKELAEHRMLVDLGRNDLGRVCLPGTVEVERYMDIEMFSHVMHIVSDVGGKVRPELASLDVLEACFPAGTVSGAPKIRAMEIIHELEGLNREVYAGAIGYIDFHDNMDTCIAIRTMVVEDGKVWVQAGAGIVYDSVPETEYQESLHKLKALFKIMDKEGEGHGTNN